MNKFQNDKFIQKNQHHINYGLVNSLHIVYSIECLIIGVHVTLLKAQQTSNWNFFMVKQMQINGVSVIPIWPYVWEETYSLGKLSGPGTKLGQGIKVNPKGVS